jgi:hypothetical protein
MEFETKSIKRNLSELRAAGFTALVTVTLFCAACATTPAGTTRPPMQANVEHITVDHKGAAVGVSQPEWVVAAVANDYDDLERLSRLQGRLVIVDYASGQNLDLLRSWVNNFNAQAQVSRRISNHVEATFGGAQLGSKDSPENRQFIKEIIATLSSVTINGLSMDMDWWVLDRTVDHGNGTQREQYNYYVVYSIAREDLDYQIAQAMGRVAARNQEQEELKTEVEDAMKRVALRGIQNGQ